MRLGTRDFNEPVSRSHMRRRSVLDIRLNPTIREQELREKVGFGYGGIREPSLLHNR